MDNNSIKYHLTTLPQVLYHEDMDDIKLRNREMQSYFWDVQTLEGVSKKYGISRERVRQIFEKDGFDAMAVKRAIEDYKKYHEIQNKYTTCKCGTNFLLDERRKRKNRLVDLCHICFLKERPKADGYNHQRRWQKAHPEKVKELAIKYYQANKDYFKEKSRRWQKAHPEINRIRAIKWYNSHKEERAAYMKKYHALHKEEISLKAKKRYQLKKLNKNE